MSGSVSVQGRPRRVAVLGSTGSIGTQTLDVIRRHPDKLQAVALAAGTRAAQLLDQVREFDVRCCALGSADALGDLPVSADVQMGFGARAVAELVSLPEVDIVVNSLVGAAGLEASYLTLKAGKVLALANKESLVVGGDLIMPLSSAVLPNGGTADSAVDSGSHPLPSWETPDFASLPCGRIMPIDSEHGAIYQCLLGERHEEVAKLWVTASGGPFRGMTREKLGDITPEAALAHPTWNMGPKITIDSSTLMNKGLEVIEAHHLFDMPYDKIEVVVQPQSAIHSMVEFSDGSVKAHLGTTDMRIPIQFALSYPDRWDAPVAPLDFRTLGSLEFFAPDTETFRCLALAREAGMRGGTLPCAMNAANEVAVAAFLQKRCSYLGIAETVEAVMERHLVEQVTSLEQLYAVDAWARHAASEYIAKRSW